MKKRSILLSIIIVIFIIGISIFLGHVDKGDELDDFNVDAHPGIEWIRVETALAKYDYAYYGGTWMTLEDVLQVSEKGTNLTGRDLWKYNFYEDRTGSYQRIYPISDLDMLFELRVGWDIDRKERFSMAHDPVDALTASEAILIAKNGLNTQVNFLTGDVEAYINEQKENLAYKTFTFAYYPIDVEGTADTLEKVASLWEKDETYISSSPDEITGVKIDKVDELYSFAEEMEHELKYTDKAVAENVFLSLGQNLDKKTAEPKFLIYLPNGNVTYRYRISKVEKHGEDLYIFIEKNLRAGDKLVKDGCLIGLQIVKDGQEPSTIKDVSRIHLEVME